jgi:methyl-accepting chemotaxis protein
MCAGVVGLLLSVAGLVGLWLIRPALAGTITTTIETLSGTVDTSQEAMVITNQALGATVDSVDALSDMLATTAITVEDTQPMISQAEVVIGETLPATFEAVDDSLVAAQEAAQSLESAMKSFDAFRVVLEATPFFGAFASSPQPPYNPEKPLADALGDLSVSLEDMPGTFIEMSASMDTADDNLELVKDNLNVMSASVSEISGSLSQYQAMLGESQASMDNLKSMLTGIQANLETGLNAVTIVFALFFLWLLAAQVVIFSQGWELYHGTAGHMADSSTEPTAVTPASTD